MLPLIHCLNLKNPSKKKVLFYFELKITFLIRTKNKAKVQKLNIDSFSLYFVTLVTSSILVSSNGFTYY